MKMTGALLLCELEFAHLTKEINKVAHVRRVETPYQPCPGKTVGSLALNSASNPIRVAYINGSVSVDVADVRVATHTSVEKALRLLRSIITCDALHDLWCRIRAA